MSLQPTTENNAGVQFAATDELGPAKWQPVRRRPGDEKRAALEPEPSKSQNSGQLPPPELVAVPNSREQIRAGHRGRNSEPPIKFDSQGQEGPQPNLVAVNGCQLAILNFTIPAPAGLFDYAASPNALWPQAAHYRARRRPLHTASRIGRRKRPVSLNTQVEQSRAIGVSRAHSTAWENSK